jgi:hypothetical protein
MYTMLLQKLLPQNKVSTSDPIAPSTNGGKTTKGILLSHPVM